MPPSMYPQRIGVSVLLASCALYSLTWAQQTINDWVYLGTHEIFELMKLVYRSED